MIIREDFSKKFKTFFLKNLRSLEANLFRDETSKRIYD
jgi:hypothetical protein